MKKYLSKTVLSPCTDSNLGLLFLRIFTGIAIMTHGYSKVFVSLDEFAQSVASLGFPVPFLFAMGAAFSEFFGGLFIALGLLTRVAAVFLGTTMFVAVFIVHSGDPFAVREMALLYLFICLFFILKGGGKFSLDRIISKKI